MLTFLIEFLILLILSGIFIVQIYNLTRHYIVINPDNSQVIIGDAIIGKYWSMFWEKIKRTDRLVYSGDALFYKYTELQRLLPKASEKVICGSSKFILKDEKAFTQDEHFKTELLLKCKLGNIEDSMFELYIEDTVYWFPDWIRKPISACPKCMSSIFGSAIWLGINYLNKDIFLWCSHPLKGFFVFWLIFCITLSYINNYLYAKYNP